MLFRPEGEFRCPYEHDHWSQQSCLPTRGECSMPVVNDRRHIGDRLTAQAIPRERTIISARASWPRVRIFLYQVIYSVDQHTTGESYCLGKFQSSKPTFTNTDATRVYRNSATAPIETTIACTLQHGHQSLPPILIQASARTTSPIIQSSCQRHPFTRSQTWNTTLCHLLYSAR